MIMVRPKVCLILRPSQIVPVSFITICLRSYPSRSTHNDSVLLTTISCSRQFCHAFLSCFLQNDGLGSSRTTTLEVPFFLFTFTITYSCAFYYIGGILFFKIGRVSFFLFARTTPSSAYFTPPIFTLDFPLSQFSDSWDYIKQYFLCNILLADL